MNIEDLKLHQSRLLKTKDIAQRLSKDPSTKVGCFIYNGGTVISVGINKMPENTHNSNFDHKETKYNTVLHAEITAIMHAIHTNRFKYLYGSTLYVYPLPTCSECAKLIIEVGIKKVVMPKIKATPKWQESFKYSKLMYDQSGVEFLFIDMGGVCDSVQ